MLTATPVILEICYTTYAACIIEKLIGEELQMCYILKQSKYSNCYTVYATYVSE